MSDDRPHRGNLRRLVEEHFSNRKTRILGRRVRDREEWASVFRQHFCSARASAGLDADGLPLSTDQFRRSPGGQHSLFNA